ncbi:hypothetical protein [Pleurocapsa sp. PCC 7319]|nr:hypothetical protein [Pleurocapsa sp. PCC 7319]
MSLILVLCLSFVLYTRGKIKVFFQVYVTPIAFQGKTKRRSLLEWKERSP